MSTTENTKTQQPNQNPYEFIYKPGQKVEIDGELLSKLISFMNNIVESNTEYYFTDKYKFINTKTNKTVKNPKQEDLDSRKVVKVVDVEGTLNSEPKPYRNQLALQTVHMNLLLQNEHLKAVKDGKAVHYSELQQQTEDEGKSPLIIT